MRRSPLSIKLSAHPSMSSSVLMVWKHDVIYTWTDWRCFTPYSSVNNMYSNSWIYLNELLKEYDFVWKRPKNKRTWIYKICIFEGFHFDFYEIVKRENILQWKVLFLRVNLTYKLYRCSSLLEEWEEVVFLVILGKDRFKTFILITKQKMKIKKKNWGSFTPFKTRNLLNASI